MDRRFIKLFSFYLLLLKHLSRRISGFQSMFDSCHLSPPNFLKLENDRWTLLFYSILSQQYFPVEKEKSLLFEKKKEKHLNIKFLLG